MSGAAPSPARRIRARGLRRSGRPPHRGRHPDERADGPVLPGLSDDPAQLRAVVKDVLDAGAFSVSPILLHLRPGVREEFMPWLERSYPELVPRYRAMYRRPYGPKAERDRLTSLVRSMVGRRPREGSLRASGERRHPRGRRRHSPHSGSYRRSWSGFDPFATAASASSAASRAPAIPSTWAGASRMTTFTRRLFEPSASVREGGRAERFRVGLEGVRGAPDARCVVGADACSRVATSCGASSRNRHDQVVDEGRVVCSAHALGEAPERLLIEYIGHDRPDRRGGSHLGTRPCSRLGWRPDGSLRAPPPTRGDAASGSSA